MDWSEEIKEKLGPTNFQLLVDNVENSMISKQQVKKIGLKMDKTKKVNGVYETKKNSEEIKDVLLYMLDKWWVVALSKPEVNGLDELQKILNDTDIGLHWLDQQMSSALGKPTISLPTSFPDIPDDIPDLLKEQLRDQTATASKPFVSEQAGPVCASHSVGKAIIDILDDLGFNADQDEIINRLVMEVQNGRFAKNPDEFKGKKINVCITEKDGAKKVDEVKIELRVLTHWGDVDRDNNTFKTEPVPALESQMKKVLRWDIGLAADSRTYTGPHAIYATDYDEKSGNYSCLNSWGDEMKTPKVHNSRIYAVDYISIKKVD